MTISYFATGVTVTDEVVAFSTSTTINGSSYYYGLVNQMASAVVGGTVSSDFGVYTSTNGGGTRYNILLEGVPTTGKLLWDVDKGVAYSVSTHGGLYATYKGFGGFTDSSRCYEMTYPGQMTDGTTSDWSNVRVNRATIFDSVAVIIDGNVPNATVAATLATSTNGGGSTATFSIPTSSTDTGVLSLSAEISVSANNPLYLRCDGQGLSAMTAYLYEKSDRV